MRNTDGRHVQDDDAAARAVQAVQEGLEGSAPLREDVVQQLSSLQHIEFALPRIECCLSCRCKLQFWKAGGKAPVFYR